MNSSPSTPPSPSSSQPGSRKRQRSESMGSEGSSISVKRAVSDGPSQDTDTIAALSLSDPSNDNDAYMAEVAQDTLTFAPAPNPSYALVPPDQKMELVDAAKAQPLVLGSAWYLVDRTWWKRWRKACGGIVDKEGGLTEDELGPVDNSPLVDSTTTLLKPVLSESVDFELVPESAWEDLVSWYGPAKYPLPRQVIARGLTRSTAVELYPLRLHVMRMVETRAYAETDPEPIIVYVSASATASEANRIIAAAVRPDDVIEGTPRRVYRANKTPPLGFFDCIEFSYTDYAEHECEIFDADNRTMDDVPIMQEDNFVVEFKDMFGRWLIDPATTEKPPPLELSPAAPIFPSNEGFFAKMTPSSSRTSAPSGSPLSSLSSKFPGLLSGPASKPIEPGTLGLGNMGNTCFMNSALQCLAHQQELVDYFLNGVYTDELNPDNPLGMQGAIAEAFGELLKKIWAPTSSSNSYSPREFKSQLQRFAPQFSGYQQHDSQELVAFLLDGLHEDLNRVIKKPYVEKPDWEGGGDVELVQLAQKSWEGYMLRNDSVIVDLFQGQYQSTLVCPECKMISITFDPFMYLTLPLPIHKKWKHVIHYIPWDPEKPHLKIPVQIGVDASWRELRNLLGKWQGVPPENLLTLEVFSQKFYKSLDDSGMVGEAGSSDNIYCFELPCNSQQNRAYKKQESDPLILPVYLTDMKPNRGYGSYYHNSFWGIPMIVLVTPEEALRPQAVYDAIVERLTRWTPQSKELYRWEHAGSVATVPLQPNGEIADSLVEITANGDVLETVEHPPEIEEGDITEEKRTIIGEDDEDVAMEEVVPGEIIRVGTKADIFSLKIQPDSKEYGTGSYSFSKAIDFRERLAAVSEGEPVVVENDLLVCEFDENMRTFYFGEPREETRWDQWEKFEHPEFAASLQEADEKKLKGISLQDCLDEFVKKEQLGEDDLWYCPKCKKHQQATKKFDLWKAPDVLVVHLKRFSNSRAMRDKIDAFIDFPIEGLDLGSMVGEQAAVRRIRESGVDVPEGLQLPDAGETAVYDLFGVDEHMGGLGGGHYRAYALNHGNGKWYHFDDSYVTPAKAEDSVNANAYLLFYRRRKSGPLGGKTQEKIQAARQKHQSQPSTAAPSSSTSSDPPSASTETITIIPETATLQPIDDDGIAGLTFPTSTSSSSPSSTSEPFEEMGVAPDALSLASAAFDFPDPSHRPSPTSSTEADGDGDEDGWRSQVDSSSWQSLSDGTSSHDDDRGTI